MDTPPLKADSMRYLVAVVLNTRLRPHTVAELERAVNARSTKQVPNALDNLKQRGFVSAFGTRATRTYTLTSEGRKAVDKTRAYYYHTGDTP